VLAQIEAKGDERMAQLVKTYEAMKPKDAARIFDTMDDKVLIDLSKSMKPATLAAVMASMDPKRAEALTRMLAALADPPASIDAIRQTTG
jgi:flagellar motility protein MotE (MotC chaperone)